MRKQSALPQRRTRNLVVDYLPDEVLVYDSDNDKAHCLNRSAALVWQSCDGDTAPSEIARQLQAELNADGGKDSRAADCEKMVWLALEQLERNQLLDQTAVAPAQFASLSRRRMIRGLGLAAAVAAPVITSIVAPTAAEAATLLAPGACCGNPNECASNSCNQNPTCVGPPQPSTKRCA